MAKSGEPRLVRCPPPAVELEELFKDLAAGREAAAEARSRRNDLAGR